MWGLLALLGVLLLLGGLAAVWWYERVKQVADPNFDSRVAEPTYRQNHPRVLFDEAHRNFHTSTGRYKPFVDLITTDGYQVTPNRGKLNRQSLAGYDLLVIANALGAILPILPGARQPAFADQECDAVRDWVREGGALLLIADHDPAGSAAQSLARRFEVEMSAGRTFDPANYDEESNSSSWLVFSRDNGLLGDHPIARGRDATESVNRVIAFTGQSLQGPEGSTPFLCLADSAVDANPSGRQRSAAGRAMGVALTFGKGRVVVLGEAAMLTAQLGGREKFPFGMNRAGCDNRQLALNIVHWLSGALN